MPDTPTHRYHILQGQMQQVVEWTQLLQARRSQIVERVVRATANNKIARALQVERSLERSLASMQRDLTSIDDKLNKLADKLNKCRGLFLELSDGEVLLEKTEVTSGYIAASAGDRGDVPKGADGPADNVSVVHDGRTPEDTA